VKNKNTMW